MKEMNPEIWMPDKPDEKPFLASSGRDPQIL